MAERRQLYSVVHADGVVERSTAVRSYLKRQGLEALQMMGDEAGSPVVALIPIPDCQEET